MGKRVILAVAGAGKTYHICHNINPDKKNLILAFTHENIYNITKELTKSFGSIPAKTTICTFHSFVYQLLIRPYEPTILMYMENNLRILVVFPLQKSPNLFVQMAPESGQIKIIIR